MLVTRNTVPTVTRGFQIILLAVFTTVAFSTCLGRGDFSSHDEAIVVELGREMAASGWLWSALSVQTSPLLLPGTARQVPEA